MEEGEKGNIGYAAKGPAEQAQKVSVLQNLKV